MVLKHWIYLPCHSAARWGIEKVSYYSLAFLLRLWLSPKQKRKKLKINLADRSIPFARVHSLKNQDMLNSSVNSWGYDSALHYIAKHFQGFRALHSGQQSMEITDLFQQ